VGDVPSELSLAPPQQTKQKVHDSPLLCISIHDQAALPSACVLIYDNDLGRNEQN
jgi:hypothetical protein